MSENAMPLIAGDPQAVARRRVIFAGAIGSAVEFYDFGVYGYLATTIAALFFPRSSASAALLSTLAIFATAFLVRPLGSVLFGHIGDRYGRKPALSIAVIVMALATFCIGFLPTAPAIGVAAPLLLLLARLIQGLSAGGEIGGAATMLAEASRNHDRGLMTSACQTGSLVGLLAAAAVVAILSAAIAPADMAAWGWRIPFILALPTGLVGLYIRRRLTEAPAFTRLARAGSVARVPAIEAFRTAFVPMLKAFGVCVMDFVAYYLVYVYMTIYLQTQAGFSRPAATWSTTVTLLVSVVALPGFGWLSDRIGRRPVIAGAGIALVLLTLPAFWLIHGGGPMLAAAAAQLVLGLCVAAIMGALWATCAELFPTRVRYSGMGIAFSVAAALVGGTAPYMATWLIAATGNPTAPAWLLIAAALVTLLTLTTMRETAGRDMPG